jgi:tetratricopeptide (TPR) repeat protein
MEASNLETRKQRKTDRLLRWPRRGQPVGWGYEVLLALLAVLTAAVALAPQVFAVFTPPIWVRIILFALACVLAIAVPVVRLHSTKLEKERNWARQVRGILQVPLGTEDQLPRLSALSPYRLGVSSSRYGSEEQRGDDPYVPRVTDERLDQAMGSKRFVLVVGDSKAGKSRTAYEAATRLRHAGQSHDPGVLVPNYRDTDHLRQLIELDPPLNLHPEPALLWLDDLAESELGALTPLLDSLAEHMIVLGSMTAQRYDRIRDSDSEISRNARLALQHRATIVIRLEAGLTTEERAQAEQKYPKEQFEAGIGEQLVAVDQLTDRYDNARQGANLHGWAVVQAVIDWARMDIGRPIKPPELLALCPLYLDQLRAHSRHDDKDHDEALRWACQPVSSHIALLEERSGDLDVASYVPFDYFVAVADGQGGRPPQPILDSAWDKVITLVSPSEAVRAGISAFLRRLPLHARKIFAAVAADHSEAAPKAAYHLGLLQQEQGELEGARASYQQAIDSSDAEWAPVAAVNLGILLVKRGDLEGAKAAYQRAMDSGHPEWSIIAALDLWGPVGEQEDFEGARAFYQQIIDSGNPDWAPLAAYNLGILLGKQGDLEGAKAAYQRAIDSGNAEWASRGAVNLGLLLWGQGDLEGAKAAYQRAINSDNAEWAALAMFNLGLLLQRQGDLEGAKAAYQRAIDTGNAEAASRGAVNLGSLLWGQGDLEGAKAAYQWAIDTGHPDWAPEAARGLENLLMWEAMRGQT